MLNQLSLASPETLITRLNQLSIAQDDDSLALDVEENQSFVLLSWNQPENSQGIAIKIRLRAPSPTIMAMYYRKQNPTAIEIIRRRLCNWLRVSTMFT